MKFDEYDENIQKLASQVLAARIAEPDKVKDYCHKIINKARKSDDNKLLGFAFYYLAEAYFLNNEYNKFMKYLIQGIKYQQEVPEGSLLARSYNMLGINSDNMGNIPAAIDYYLTSLKYCRENGLTHEASLANINIGQIYMAVKEYKTAIHYLQTAMKYLEQDKESIYSLNMVVTKTSIATCYYQLKDMESALRYFHNIEKERKKYLTNTHSQMIILIFEVTIYNALKEYTKRDELIDKLLILIEGIPSFMDIYDDAFAFCEILKETGRYENLWKVLGRIEELTEQAGITNMKLRALRFKLQCYQKFSDERAYLQACSDLYKLSEKLENENKAIARKAIELRMDLEQVKEKQTLIQEENKLLLEKSEKDPLTQLPNREKLNHYSEEAFEKAFHNQTSLGVEIFDIDCFKQYNDTYGHQDGDKCLKKIAQLLHALMEKGIFCARYGGDEFIIIYENMTDEAILEMARKLQQDVIALGLKNKNSTANPVVTITQGIRNSVPKEGNKIWDYFFAADMTMYQVKRTTKNDISLVHRAN